MALRLYTGGTPDVFVSVPAFQASGAINMANMTWMSGAPFTAPNTTWGPSTPQARSPSRSDDRQPASSSSSTAAART